MPDANEWAAKSGRMVNSSGNYVNEADSFTSDGAQRVQLKPQSRLTAFAQIVGNNGVTDIPSFTGPSTFQFPITADTTLSSSGPTKNNGTYPQLMVSGGTVRRSIIKAEFSGLDASKVTSAKLKLYDTNLGTPVARTVNGTVNIHAMLSANAGWVEGVGNNANALAGEATWGNKAEPSTAWTGGAGLGTAGYDASIMGTIPSVVGQTGYVESVLDLNLFKSYVQAGNAGLLLKLADETNAGSIIQFTQRETVAQRGYFEVVSQIAGTPHWIVFEANGVGAKVLDGSDPNGAGILIPTNGLVLPANSVSSNYKVYVPTGVSVTYFVMGEA